MMTGSDALEDVLPKLVPTEAFNDVLPGAVCVHPDEGGQFLWLV